MRERENGAKIENKKIEIKRNRKKIREKVKLRRYDDDEGEEGKRE